MLPPALWSRLAQAPCIELVAERADRARYLVSAYAELTADRAALEAAIERLPVHPSRQRLAGWRALADAGAFADLADALLAVHYDPAYDRARRKSSRPLLGSLPVRPGDADEMDRAAETAACLTLARSGATLGAT